MSRTIELKFAKHVLTELLKTPRTNLPTAVIACSGGVDSVVLATLLAKLYGKAQADKLCLAYVNHHVRPESEIRKDIKVIRKLGKSLGLTTEVLSLESKPKSRQNEAALREGRYEELLKLAKKRQASTLFTAHHADDVLETWILAISRGVHPKSTTGIQPIKELSAGVKIIRPLLEFTKSDLTNYANAQKLTFHEDSTNQDLKYTRNYVRAKVIPAISGIRTGALKQWLAFFSQTKAEAKVSDLSDHDILNQMLSSHGVLFRQLFTTQTKTLSSLDFDRFAHILKLAFGKENQRTNKGQWNSLNKVVADRNATRLGSGPKKSVQFPGGWRVEFKENRIRLHQMP